MDKEKGMLLFDIIENTEIIDKVDDIYKTSYDNWKFSINDRDKEADWGYGELLEVSPLTYALGFSDLKELILSKILFEKIIKIFNEKGIKNTNQFQSPKKTLGYLDTKKWDNKNIKQYYLLYYYGIINIGKINDESLYKGGIANPVKFLENIEKYTDKITKQEANDLLQQAKAEVELFKGGIQDLKDKTNKSLNDNFQE